jgi:hypothetical protein
MANSATPSKTFYTPTHKADGTKLSKAERRAANKAKWAAEQAAKRKASKSKKKTKAKVKTAVAPAPSKTAHRTNLEQWLKDNPNRQTMKLGEFEQLGGRTKMAKRLDRKGRTDSGLSKRNNKLEVQAQYKGGQLAAF